MEFTDETLQKIIAKKEINRSYQLNYYWFSKVLEQEELYNYSRKVFNRGERLKNCLDYWQWKKYKKNKVLDLQKVNRCNNNRFCPNCRAFEISKFIHHFGQVYKEQIYDKYNPYLLTLTVPNVEGKQLSETITRLYDSFKRFFQAFNQDIGQGKKGYKDRLITFVGGLRVLEITYNSKTNMFHPHLHCIILSEEYCCELFKKQYQGEYSYKRKRHNMYSELDLHLQKVWYMCYNKLRLSKKNYDSLEDKYLVDIKELNENGIYEVIKYTFKDTDAQNNKYVFKNLVIALENRRIRQGFGVLLGLKCENVEEGQKQNIEDYLLVDKKEVPKEISMEDPRTLLTPKYKNYRKVSRFKSDEILNNLD